MSWRSEAHCKSCLFKDALQVRILLTQTKETDAPGFYSFGNEDNRIGTSAFNSIRKQRAEQERKPLIP